MTQTRRRSLDLNQVDMALIQEAAAVIERGGLVAFPTETVYGLACKVDPDALARLSALKGRTPDKRYTLHVGSPEAVDAYVPSMDQRIEVLLNRGWPGPLTVVFSLNQAELDHQRLALASEVYEALYIGGSLGVRCPDHRVAAALLGTAQCPVVAPSANPHRGIPCGECR